MFDSKAKITYPGQRAQLDIMEINKDILRIKGKKYYLVCIMDEYTRVCWGFIAEGSDPKILAVAIMRTLEFMAQNFEIVFDEIVCSDTKYFNQPTEEVMAKHWISILSGLVPKGIHVLKGRGCIAKMLAFWKFLSENLFQDYYWKDAHQFNDNFYNVLKYYNAGNLHSSLKYKKPLEFLDEYKAKLLRQDNKLH